jgi:hypothetical protein
VRVPRNCRSLGNRLVTAINFASEAKEGELVMSILDSSNDLVAELETNISGTREINSDKNQKYRLVIRGTQTKGNFNVNWEIN